MPICQKCKEKFPNRVKIDGKTRVIHKRKYCLNCSPFGEHNTKKLNGKPRKDQKPYRCYKCGETDESKFYGHKRNFCSACYNKYTADLCRKKRQKAIDALGGGCSICGYSKYIGSIDFHHLDPESKDPHFKDMRSWSWERIEEEIKKCVLLCRNCHGEVHGKLTEL